MVDLSAMFGGPSRNLLPEKKIVYCRTYTTNLGWFAKNTKDLILPILVIAHNQ